MEKWSKTDQIRNKKEVYEETDGISPWSWAFQRSWSDSYPDQIANKRPSQSQLPQQTLALKNP